MKMIMVLSVILGITLTSRSQDISASSVPSAIITAFNTAYPNAADVEWEKISGMYKVEFEIGKADHDIWYEASGKVVRHRFEISATALPAPVTDMLNRDFKDYRIDGVDQIEENGTVQYKIDVEGATGDRKLWVDPQGTMLSNMAD